MTLLDRIYAEAAGRAQRPTPAKAMLDLHPEMFDRVHMLGVMQHAIPLPSGMNYLEAISHFESAVWIRKAINVWANNLSALPLGVVQTADGQDDPLPEHPVSLLLERVNDRLSSADLWQQWAVDMALGGEAFWELLRDRSGALPKLWPRQPHIVTIIPDEAGRRYYRVLAYKVDDHLGPAYELPPSEAVHFRFYNPRNPWRGIAPITAVRMGIAIDLL